TDGRGKKVYLSDAIVIMTSNLGSESFKKYEKPLGFGQKTLGDVRAIKNEVMKAAEVRFSPEFRNRIDEIVVFSPLMMDEVRQIAVLYLSKLRKQMEYQGKEVEVTEKAIDLSTNQQAIFKAHTFMNRRLILSARRFVFILLLICLTALSVLAQDGKTTPQTPAGTDEKAEQVIQRAIEALGRASYLNVRSVTGRGQFTQFKDGQSGLPSAFVDYIIFPDRERTEFKSHEGRII